MISFYNDKKQFQLKYSDCVMTTIKIDVRAQLWAAKRAKTLLK